jgi:hypothetical protein
VLKNTGFFVPAILPIAAGPLGANFSSTIYG